MTMSFSKEGYEQARADGTHPVEMLRKKINWDDPDCHEAQIEAAEVWDEFLDKIPETYTVARLRAYPDKDKFLFIACYVDGVMTLRKVPQFVHATFLTQLMGSLIAYMGADEGAMVVAIATQVAVGMIAEEEGERAAESFMDLIKTNAMSMMQEWQDKDPDFLSKAEDYLGKRGLL